MEAPRRRLPPLNALRAFEAAARHSNFTRAAEELSVTQTAVSQQVKLLEEFLGFRLFRRLHNSLELTDRGAQYLPALREAFASIGDATEALLGEGKTPRLTLSVMPNFALRWLIPRLQRWQALHPDVELLVQTDRHGLETLAEEVDLAIRFSEAPPPGLHAEPLLTDEIFPVCAPSLAAALDAPARLAGAALLHVETSPEDWPVWLTAAGCEGLQGRPAPRFDTYALALEAAHHGCGVAIGHGPFVAHDLAMGRLVAPFTLRVARAKTWWLLSPRGRARRPVVQFRAWILSEARRQG
ncbi:transcriptional regulator GcvA [Crenalkalicoccus roseus]|uniref:transcriptional regulator GcvA n=1 Tax=Crenalkalicoccus roseus TaxID=1485588 RepID=UPI001082176E|nr:transcriptional regulator GcvA [Crenalkalicoccus roseus]